MGIKIISLFISSPNFNKLDSGETDVSGEGKFPFYDPVGWIYTKQTIVKDANITQGFFAKKYLVDERELPLSKVLLCKNAHLFYGTIVLLSIILVLIFGF